jgi:site-specific DNA-cytosine methylase
MDRWKQVVSNTRAYKAFGNAVTVTVAQAVAFSLSKTIQGETA